MQVFYYNGTVFVKNRRTIYISQGLSGPTGFKRIMYKKGRNVRGYRTWYDPIPKKITSGS